MKFKFDLGRLISTILLIVFVGNVLSSFFRYTGIYKPLVPKHFIKVLLHQQYDRFDNKLFAEIKTGEK